MQEGDTTPPPSPEGELARKIETETATRAFENDMGSAAKLAADSEAFQRGAEIAIEGDLLEEQVEAQLDQAEPAPPPQPRRFKCKLGGEIYTGEIAEWKEAAEACLSGEGVCQLEEIGPDGEVLATQPPAIDIEIKLAPPPEPAPFFVCHKGHRQQGGFFHTIPPNEAAGFPGMRFGPACRQCLFEWIAQKFRTRPEKKRPLKSVPANDVEAPAAGEPTPA